jgi:hypothetical protein
LGKPLMMMNVPCRRLVLIPAVLLTFGSAACTAAYGGNGRSLPQETHGAGANGRLGEAPDATGRGPFTPISSEYRFPAAVDEDVLRGRFTELWSKVYRPAALTSPASLAIFLHGNGRPCGKGYNPRIDDSFADAVTGTCPPGYRVAPVHEGFAYLAEPLASWGYVVVSINATRGLAGPTGVQGDSTLNAARGRLVLKHLQLLSQWSAIRGSTPASLGIDLYGKLDFRHVGLMGHSRGGEGVRAAIAAYKAAGSEWPKRILAPVNFDGLFEIGTVDTQELSISVPSGVAYGVLLPMCDGDSAGLTGMRVFDRTMISATAAGDSRIKASMTVWGANHNYYNSEYHGDDTRGTGCVGYAPIFTPCKGPQAANTITYCTGQVGSQAQRATGLALVSAFFRGNVGAASDPAFNRTFDPLWTLPASLGRITRIDRGFNVSTGAGTTLLEDFTSQSGLSKSGAANVYSQVSVTHGGVPEHGSDAAPSLRAARISWTVPGRNTYHQFQFAEPGAGIDIPQDSVLEFRVEQTETSHAPQANFLVRLVSPSGRMSSPVHISRYVVLTRPVGSGRRGLHTVLQTARIPVRDFMSLDVWRAEGMRFIFDQTPNASIYVADIRLANVSGYSR